MSRVRNAIVPSPRTSDGVSMCIMLPQPATGSTVAPSVAFRFTKASWPNAANTKLGTEMPKITRNMIAMSGSRLRYSAVSAPNRMPPAPAKAMASTPNVADTGKCSRMMSLTLRFSCENEMPKSPCSMLPM